MTTIAVTKLTLVAVFLMAQKGTLVTKQKYTVRILDNFHFMDESEEYNSGTFNTYEEAVAKCKRIIDEFLESAHQPGETAEQLYGTYVMFGETPLIDGSKTGDFSANDYCRERCKLITIK